MEWYGQLYEEIEHLVLISSIIKLYIYILLTTKHIQGVHEMSVVFYTCPLDITHRGTEISKKRKRKEKKLVIIHTRTSVAT